MPAEKKLKRFLKTLVTYYMHTRQFLFRRKIIVYSNLDYVKLTSSIQGVCCFWPFFKCSIFSLGCEWLFFHSHTSGVYITFRLLVVFWAYILSNVKLTSSSRCRHRNPLRPDWLWGNLLAQPSEVPSSFDILMWQRMPSLISYL